MTSSIESLKSPKAMLFTILKKHLQIPPPLLPKLLFQQCQLEYVTVHKNLSLTFSDDLSWSLYINNIANNAYTKKNLAMAC